MSLQHAGGPTPPPSPLDLIISLHGLHPPGPQQQHAPHTAPLLHNLHADEHDKRAASCAAAAAIADTPCVFKSPAASSSVHARPHHGKRAAGLVINGSGPVLPLLVTAAAAAGCPCGTPPAGVTRCGARSAAAPSRSGGTPFHEQQAAAAQMTMHLARWAAVALVGLLLLAVVIAPGAAGGAAQRPTPYDIQLNLGPYFFNPSIVKHRGVYLTTARTAHMRRIDSTNWWTNEAFVCMSTTPDFESVSCRKFDPWQG